MISNYREHIFRSVEITIINPLQIHKNQFGLFMTLKFPTCHPGSSALTVLSAPVRNCCCHEANTQNAISLHLNNFNTTSIRHIHLHAWHYVCKVCGNWQITKEKFKFRCCLTVVHWNLHLNVLRMRKNGCSSTLQRNTANTETKRRLIYANDTESENKYFTTKEIWIQNRYRISHTKAREQLKSGIRITECSVCAQITPKSQSHALTPWKPKRFLATSNEYVWFNKCVRDAFTSLHFMLHFDRLQSTNAHVHTMDATQPLLNFTSKDRLHRGHNVYNVWLCIYGWIQFEIVVASDGVRSKGIVRFHQFN